MVLNQTKILIYELNEVPRRLYDFYIEKYPNSSFAFLKKKGLVFNTFTKDDGELHPWSTWPTVHRGVYNFEHNIRFINQDLTLSKKYKPIWEILSEENIDVGIFGSLQSYPPIINKNVKFYLPDTFSPDSKAIPETLSLFQNFNLSMVGENKAISRSITNSQLKLFYQLTKRGCISIKTYYAIIEHLINEKLNVAYKSRRSLMQNVIGFDLFFKTLREHKPTFCTYFTNHVAGMMHRYWKDLFPEDFDLNKDQAHYFHSKSILKGMHIADKNLTKLLKFTKSNNYDLWVISSMGQDAIDRGEYIPELYLKDFKKFLFVLELKESDFKLLPAMQPDYCVKCSSAENLNILKNLLEKIRDKNGNQIILERYSPTNNILNIYFARSKTIPIDEKLIFSSKEYNIKNFGLQILRRDVGTGYHIPQGIFISIGKSNSRLKKYKNQIIETKKFCPTILNLLNVAIPEYMASPL